MEHIIKDFMDYLDASPSSFQAAEQSISRLVRAGFEHLDESKAFDLKKGGKYFVSRNQSSVIAFIIGNQDPDMSGFKLAASHLDSPSLKLKPESVNSSGGICKVAVDVYGGPIIHTWTDKELGIAGRVSLLNRDSEDLKHKNVLINLAKALAIIPNAAIHLNRDVNNGFVYNKQTHLCAMLGCDMSHENPLHKLVADELDIDPKHIASMDLFLYDLAKASLCGINEDFIVSGRLDNLAMSHAILTSLLKTEHPQSCSVAVLYDNEEIGSQTLQGASGSFLGDILERISLAMGLDRSRHLMALQKSFLVSADMAHAFHPSYAEKYDPAYAPAMNKGPVIKMNANFRYSTTSESAVAFMRLCELSEVNCQSFMTRSDLPCGSTIGPISSSLLGIAAVDIGNPMWAMHSIRETCGARDHTDLIKVLNTFYKE